MNREERLEHLKPLLRKVLDLLGEDPTREGLERTPERWADALLSYTEGAWEDPSEHLKVVFHLDEPDDAHQRSDQLVIVDNIAFTSTCEHHVAPFRGVVHIGYLPNPESQQIVGLSKLSRVVDVFAHRLQIQERMTRQIGEAIDQHLRPMGVVVVAQAVHYCMVQRGVKQGGSMTLTTARFGAFMTRPELEARFLEYLRLSNGSGRQGPTFTP